MKTAYMWIDPQLATAGRVTGLRLPVAEAATTLRTAGYTGLELMIGDPAGFDTEALRSALVDSDLALSQICTGELFGSYGLALNHEDPEMRRRALRAGVAVIQLAAGWGCPVGIGRFRGRMGRDADATMARMGESLRSLDRVATREGVRILLEPLRPDVCDTLSTVAGTARAIRDWGLDSTGWLLDTDHVDLGQSAGVAAESESLGYVHFADSRHVPLGRGSIDFVAYVRLLARIGFRGYCGIEVFPDSELNDTMLPAAMAARLTAYCEAAGLSPGREASRKE
jgi:sugar phosphate isomerase/epimerase